ncbi:MAG: DEAD/DEAH box helicase [Clostridia bacterium]|nr:DEAD/DEAH box helicase [Clostridia bacterium]
MYFDWDKHDSNFLLKCINSSDLSDKLKKLAEDSYDDKDQLAGLMKLICIIPDKRFIMDYRRIVEQELIFNYKETVNKICKAQKITARSENDKYRILAEKPLSSSLIDSYIRAIYDICGYDVPIESTDKFHHTVAINLKNTESEEVKLEDYQQKAVERLREFFLEDDNKSGMLVMPTGSGKTRTAVYFLTREMISRGYQIIWIAHRYMLIEQAAESMYNFAGLIKEGNPKADKYCISCISGNHLRITQAHKGDNLIASIASVCRSKDHLLNLLGRKIMIVVDEAHHTYAESYRDTIKFIKDHRSNVKTLGLTATPVRADDRASYGLWRLFDNNLIYSISMSELISKGVLSEPKPIRIETNECFEPDLSDEEIAYISKYDDLPDTVLRKIGSSKSRNKLIVDEYLNNRDNYGKTLIFALDIIHCRLLCEEFQKAGIACGCVYSGNPDNEFIIGDFKRNKIKVLINVNIMTEGSDVPDIQTVFITRPTQSEGFLVQMIGRAMRGKKFGGTETANVVDFCDRWNIFKDWLNPEFLFENGNYEPVENVITQEEIENEKLAEKEIIRIEWKKVLEVYNAFRFVNNKAKRSVMMPAGWYTFNTEDGYPYRMLFFSNQVKGIIKMKENASIWKNDDSIDASYVLKKCFDYFCDAPSDKDINAYLWHIRNCGEKPDYHMFSARTEIDPYYVAQKTNKDSTDFESVVGKIYDSSEAAKDLYESRESYIEAVRQMYSADYVLGEKVEELPLELIPYDLTPHHNLQNLTKQVVDDMFGGDYNGVVSVEWTDCCYRTYFGVNHRDGRIHINKVLNSKQVDEKVIKFVIYHEFLHQDIRGHGPEFKKREHQFEGYAECESFLFGKMNEFDIKGW